MCRRAFPDTISGMKDKSPLPAVNESSIIEFNRFHFVLKNLLPSGVMHEEQYYYSSHPLIRQTLRKVTNLIATDFGSLFANGGDDAVGISQRNPDRGFMLGKLIDRLEYFTVQGDVITVVTSAQRFAREQVTGPLLKSLLTHIRSLIAAAYHAEGAGSDGDNVADLFPGAADIGSLPASLTCRHCGRCCSTFDVVCSTGEIETIAAFLELSTGDLRERYLGAEPYTWSDHGALIRKSSRKGRDSRCLFLTDEPSGLKSCAIYEARPKACRSYLPGTPLCLRPDH